MSGEGGLWVKLDLVGGGAGFVAGRRVGSEVVGLLVVSLLDNGAMPGFGSEMHPFLGFKLKKLTCLDAGLMKTLFTLIHNKLSWQN